MDNLFLRLTDVDGESLDEAHTKAIEIREWKGGLSNSATYKLNKGDDTKQTSVDHMEIEKMVDRASVTLVNKCAHGNRIAKATITCRKNAGDKKFEYLVIVLEEVKILSVKWGGRGEEARGIPETVHLAF